MKRLWCVLLLVAASSLTLAQNPLSSSITRDKTFTGARDTISITDKDYQFIRVIVKHDSGTVNLFVSFGDDTTATQRYVIKPNDGFVYLPQRYGKKLIVRADSLAVHARIWIQ